MGEEKEMTKYEAERIKLGGVPESEVFRIMNKCQEETKNLKHPWDCLKCGTRMKYQTGQFELICPNCGIHRYWY